LNAKHRQRIILKSGREARGISFPAHNKLDISFVRCMHGTEGMSAVDLRGPRALLHPGSSQNRHMFGKRPCRRTPDTG